MSRRIAFISFTQHISDAFLNGIAEACLHKGHSVKKFFHHGQAATDNDCVTPWGNFYLKDIEAFNPDRLIIFNGYAKETSGVTSYLCRRYKTFFVERGWLPQKGNIYIDEVGLGGRSSISKTNLSNLSVDVKIAENAVDDLRQKLYSEKFINSYGDYILVPLQLDHDTSIVLDSPYFKSMESLLQFIAYNFRNEKVIVTPHPLCPDVTVPGGFLKIPHIPTIQLAQTAKAIIGINSTVMIESLIHHKPVAMLGRSVVSGSDVTYAPELSLGFPRNILDRYSPDPDRINRVLFSLLNKQFPVKEVPDHVVKQIEV
jgi:hypothetical protein